MQIPLTNLRAGDKAISVSCARVCNNVPDGIKQAQSLDIFKRKLKEYLIKSQQLLMQAADHNVLLHEYGWLNIRNFIQSDRGGSDV